MHRGNAALALLPLGRQASSEDKDAARADARPCLVVERWFASRLVYLRRRLRRSVGEQVPDQAVGQRGKLEAVRFPVGVGGQVHAVVRPAVAGVPHDGEQPAVRRPVRFPGPHAVPADRRERAVLLAAPGGRAVPQHGVLPAESDGQAGKAEKVSVLADQVPVEPRHRPVVAVGVVVALLGAARLVAG